LVAIVTFGTELRTKSVRRGVAIGSLVLASLMLLLTRSPVAFGAFIAVVAADLAFYGLKRVPADRTRFWQLGLLIATVTIGGVVWAARTAIIDTLSVSNELRPLLGLWQPMRALIAEHQLES